MALSKKTPARSGSLHNSQKQKKQPRESYTALARRFGLPDEKLLAQTFDLMPLEKEDFPLREVVKKIADRFDWAAQILEGVIQPEHLAGLTEVDTLAEGVRKDAHQLYRSVMFLLRESQLQLLDVDEERHARFIKDVWGRYGEMRTRLESILTAMRDSWKGPAGTLAKKVAGQDRGSAGYFG